MKKNKNFILKKLSLAFILLFGGHISAYAQVIWKYDFLQRNMNLPIKPSRTISFDTDQASFMDISISPDDKTLLFNILGDVYSMPTAGGKAVQLTRGLAMRSKPSWSPDGSKFACVSDANGGFCLEIISLKGKTLNTINLIRSDDQLYKFRRNFIWLPSGREIIYNAVGIINTENGSIRPIPEEFSKSPQIFHVSKSNVYYNIEGNPGHLKKYDIKSSKGEVICPNLVFDTAEGTLMRVTPDEKFAVYPNISKYRDNKSPRIVKTELLLLNLKTGEEKVIVSPLTSTTLWNAGELYSFSSDSRKLYIGYGGKIHQIDLNSNENKVIPFIADIKSDLGILVRNPTKVDLKNLHVRYIKNVHKSPSGNQLVFEALNKIFIMDISSGKSRLLCNQDYSQSDPNYSPDGKWIAFTTRSDNGKGYLWKVPSSGGKPIKIFDKDGDFRTPNWSNGGDKLTFIKKKKDSLQLMLFDQKSAEVKTIVDNIIYGYKSSIVPQFSSDDSSIFFGTDDPKENRKKRYSIFSVVDIASKKTRSVSVHQVGRGWPEFIDKVVLSPDNEYMIISRMNSLFIRPFKLSDKPDTLMNDETWTEISRFAKGGVDPSWSSNGKTITWSYGDNYHELSFDRLIDAMKKQNPKRLTGVSYKNIELSPDKTVKIVLDTSKAYGKGTVAFTNARIITIKGNEIIENGTVVIKDGRISDIKSGSDLKLNKDVKVIDMAGKTIMPGMIDVHDHMHLDDDLIPQQDWKLLVNLAYGITTAIDPSAKDEQFGYSELLESGVMIGPRLYTSSTPVVDNYLIKSLSDADKIVKDRAVFGGRLVKEYDQDNRLTRQWTLIGTKRYGLNMTNESNQKSAYEALAQFKDGSSGVEHEYNWWQESYKDVKTFVARSGTWLTPTLNVTRATYGGYGGDMFFVNYYKNIPDKKLDYFFPISHLKWKNEPVDTTLKPEFLPLVKTNIELLKNGAIIPVGSHGNIAGIAMHWELYGMHLGGMDNMSILQCATIHGARTIGLDKDLGSLEKGKIADLIILDKNPLDNIENSRSIKYVMKSGILYNADNLSEIWPLKKPAPKWKNPDEK